MNVTLENLRKMQKLHKAGLPISDGWMNLARAIVKHKDWTLKNFGAEEAGWSKLELEEATKIIKEILPDG